MTPEEVEVVLTARVGQYNADVKSAATTFDRSMKQIATSAANMDRATGTAFNNARISQQILQRVGRGVSDQFAASGLSLQLFTTHLGELAEAGAYAGGSLGKFGAFLAGPWGVAATLAASVLLPLITNLIKTGDSTDDVVAKLKEHFEKTQENERAQGIFADTIEGVTQALDDDRKALDALNPVQETAAQKALTNANETEKHTIKLRENTVAALENAKAKLAQINANGLTGNPDAPEAALIQAQDQLKQINAALDDANEKLAKAKQRVIEARADVVIEKASRSPEDVLDEKYKQLKQDARNLAIAQNQVGDALDRQVKALEAAHQVELKRLQDSKRAGQHLSNDQSGRDLSFAQARTIAESAGLQVNSDYRSTGRQKQLYDAWVAAGKPASNPVARPGSGAHEGVEGKWALDIQLADGVTPALLRKVFGAEGVTLTKVLKEQGHYHIEGKRSEADVAADKAAEAEAKKAQALDKQLATTQKRLDVEAQVNALRATGDDLLKERADQIEVDYQIESQFPELANSTNAADKARLQTLKDIADQAIREKYAREGTTLIPKNLDETVKQGLHQMVEAADHASDELKRKQQEQIRTLAGFYEDMFRGGSHAIWRDFKQVGLSVIAEVLARFTASKLSGGGAGGGFGSILDTAISSVLPGFASGGSMTIGGRGGVDRNVLSLNGQPIARVSSGETMHIGNPGLMRGGGPAIINQTFVLDARGGITTPELLEYVNHTAAAAATQMGGFVARGVMKTMPARLAAYSRDGT